MGRAKDAWIEAQDRGWSSIDKAVCENCVDDDYLKDIVNANAAKGQCDYCGNSPSAEVDLILEPIALTFLRHYAEPGAAGVPRDDGDWVIDNFESTYEALANLGLECQDDLFEDICNSFDNDFWIECADGYWLGQHRSASLISGWENLQTLVTERTRFFFLSLEGDDDPQMPSPMSLLESLRGMIESFGLVRTIGPEQELFRVRSLTHDDPRNFETLGPPPIGVSSSGRMNPAGISYFYASLEAQSAIGEVVQRPPLNVTIASFRPVSEMTLIDLTNIPDFPSFYDVSRAPEFEFIAFLNHFVDAISQPVTRTSPESIDYLPSQVVSEFFSQIANINDSPVSGIAYRSTVVEGGINVVIFPAREIWVTWEQQLSFVNSRELQINTWRELNQQVLIPNI